MQSSLDVVSRRDSHKNIYKILWIFVWVLWLFAALWLDNLRVLWYARLAHKTQKVLVGIKHKTRRPLWGIKHKTQKVLVGIKHKTQKVLERYYDTISYHYPVLLWILIETDKKQLYIKKYI